MPTLRRSQPGKPRARNPRCLLARGVWIGIWEGGHRRPRVPGVPVCVSRTGGGDADGAIGGEAVRAVSTFLRSCPRYSLSTGDCGACLLSLRGPLVKVPQDGLQPMPQALGMRRTAWAEAHPAFILPSGVLALRLWGGVRWHRQDRRPWRWSIARAIHHRQASLDDATRAGGSHRLSRPLSLRRVTVSHGKRGDGLDQVPGRVDRWGFRRIL